MRLSLFALAAPLSLALAACQPGPGGSAPSLTNGGGRGDGPPPLTEAECQALVIDAGPATLLDRGVALVMVEPSLVTVQGGGPVALTLREQLSGETATLSCLGDSGGRAIVWGGVPPGRWHVTSLTPLPGRTGKTIALTDAKIAADELRLGAGEAVHLGRPVWVEGPAGLDFQPGFDAEVARADARKLAPDLGTAIYPRQLGVPD